MSLPAWTAAPISIACVAVGILINRRLWGFLPDDPPGAARKGHARPTSLAGVLLAPVVIGFMCTEQLWLLAAGATIALITGFVDDWWKERELDFDWRIKAVGLLGAAGCVAAHTALRHDLDALSTIALLIVAFVLINACNFLDNTDGVCAALAATGLLLASGGNGALAAAGFAAIGFLPCNWPRPEAFLGDAGALMLGVCLAAAAVECWPDPAAMAAPVAVLAVDFTQVVLARLALGFPPWIGDRRHLTHIAITLGLPKVAVAPVFAGLAAVGWWLATRAW